MTRDDRIARAIVLAETDSNHSWQEQDRLWTELKAEYKHINFNSIGDSVGPGWWLPLLEAFDGIEAIMVSEPEYRFSVRQIKEKFGGLRFYWSLECADADVEDDDSEDVVEDTYRSELAYRISQLTQAAEDKCEKRCETCGDVGELRGGGWLKTLCDKHNKGRK